ncbi:ComEA family DNA-binding protein [Thermodesulforhabdus norvegica]|uniref:Helix-hairpin-helix motif-containing protein n=1 Tax=Thermodesulforhabdus norvegica TaxID=39841 RepID=A0A1I4R1P9_9BACT|nr:helix-hairpin-helix domain-containing protein [Thermodesulforhabdus norvegica]SFM46244.1 Helix-hairpin-helix motif-containing protein [Thermodesulforhabdus norvegica]
MKFYRPGKEAKIYMLLAFLAVLITCYSYMDKIRCTGSREPPCTFVELVIETEGKSRLMCLQSPTPTLKEILQAEIPSYDLTQCGPYLDLPMKTGDAVYLHNTSEEIKISLGTMQDRYRLALGLPVNINSAPFQVLRALPYITDEAAKQIIEMRKKQSFRVKKELTRIEGIGEKRLKEIEPFISCSPTPSPVEICRTRLRSESF